VRRALAALALAALVGGCAGGDDEPEAASSTTSTTGAPTTTAAPTTTTTTVDLTSRPVPPAGPEAVADVLVDTDAALHDTGRPDDDPGVVRAAHEQQVALRALADHPEWDAAVAAALPTPELRRHAADNVEANRQLRSLVRTPKPELPAWEIVPAAPAAELKRYYEEAEAAHGVPWEYLAAVHLVESRMGRLRGISTAGARGPMQFLPSTWDAYGMGGDIEDTRDAIFGAANYLEANGGAAGNMANALYRYNPTEKYVRAVTLYAERMVADPPAYRGYWGWQVYYWSTLGDVWLREGWRNEAPRPVTPADLT
jgi:membrane-bound lytic murein transglycosylase B